MNQRFAILTFAACTVTFAGIWAATAPTPALTSAPVVNAPSDTMYADCDAVRAAGAAPLRASQPGYRPALDPNMNGIACETVGGSGTVPVMDIPPNADTGSVAPAPDDAPPPVEQLNPPPPGASPEELSPLP